MGQIYLIRHGQAAFAQNDYDQLTELGFEQARVLGQHLRTRLPCLDLAFSGVMRRHRETGATCLAAYGATVPIVEMPAWNEYDHEVVIERAQPRYRDKALMMSEMAREPDPRLAFQLFFRGAVQRWISGAYDAQYQESWPVFKARCVAALEQVIACAAGKQSAVVFTSGGTITALCQHLLRLPTEHVFELNWVTINCGVTKIVCGERGQHLISFNEHAHFDGANKHLISYR